MIPFGKSHRCHQKICNVTFRRASRQCAQRNFFPVTYLGRWKKRLFSIFFLWVTCWAGNTQERRELGIISPQGRIIENYVVLKIKFIIELCDISFTPPFLVGNKQTIIIFFYNLIKKAKISK